MGFRALVITMVLVIAAPIALRYSFVGLLMYYWITFLAPHRLHWSALGLPWAKVFAIIVLLSWLFSRESKRVPFNSVVAILAAFCGWTLFTSLFARFPDHMVVHLTHFSKAILICIITMALANSRARIHAIIWVIVISISFYSIKGGVFVVTSGGNYNVAGLPGHIVGGSNEAARAFLFTIPFIYFLYAHSANRAIRWGLLITLVLTVLALIGTNSRGGFAGFGIMMLFVWLHSKYKIKSLVIVMVLVTIAVIALPQKRIVGWTGRIATTQEYEEDYSATSRLQFWRNSIAVANANPLGWGFGSRRGNLVALPNGKVTARSWHSNYFMVLADHGYIGLVLYVSLALSVLVYSIKLSSVAKKNPETYWVRDLAILTRCAMIGYFVGGVFIGHSYWEPYYYVMAILVAAGQVQQATAKGAEPAVEVRPAITRRNLVY